MSAPISPSIWIGWLIGSWFVPGDLPTTLLAELTHRCPLHCPYCSNPTELAAVANELTTPEWVRVLKEAAELGALHVGFSGGEPLQRSDLADLIAAARSA